MRLTIIPGDNAIYVDGDCRMVDISSCGVPTEVHALQWYENKGWIEFKHTSPFEPKPANQEILELPGWASATITKWNEWIPEPEPEPLLVNDPDNQPVSTGTQEL